MAKGDVGYTAGSGVNIGTIEKTEGATAREIERIALDTDQMNFGTALWSAYSTVDGETSAIDTEGKSHLVLRATLTDDAAAATLRAKWEDYSGTPLAVYSEEFALANTKILDGTRAICEIIVLKTYGAKQMMIRLESISSGDDISLWACAI